MFRAPFIAAAVLVLTSAVCSAQQNEPSATATCTLDDGRQIYVRYNPVTAKAEKISNGKAWTPGGQPMTLFTEAPLSLGSSAIPIGAYTLYPIPGRDKWTIAVNRNVTPGSPYDEKQDVARTAMETDAVPDAAQQLEVALGHAGSKCSLRIYFGKVATFADFVAH